MTRTLIAALLAGLTGCGSLPRQSACFLPDQRRTFRTELFFGRDIAGRQPVTDAEWGVFVDKVVAKEFPDGFTVLDGEGQWRDPATQSVVRERSKILIIATANTAEFARRIEAVREAYRDEFHQTSVGATTQEGCAAF